MRKMHRFVRQGQACPGATTQPVWTTDTRPIAACEKCGVSKKSGELSCCARGGSWFGRCGNFRDIFDYHWDDGIDACRQTGQAMISDGHDNEAKVAGCKKHTSQGTGSTLTTECEPTVLAIDIKYNHELTSAVVLTSALVVYIYT